MTLPCESSGATEEDYANAILLAAAPAMREALHDAEIWLSYFSSGSIEGEKDQSMALAAVKRAFNSTRVLANLKAALALADGKEGANGIQN